MGNNSEEINEAAVPAAQSPEQPVEGGKKVKEKKPNKFVGAFDKFFKFTERGSTMSKEVFSGVSAFIVSACIIFINIAVIGRLTIQPNVSLSDGTGFYTGLYLVTMICALIGTMLIGLLCNLPLIQSAGLGLASSFIAITGGDGLTFANVLTVTFISAAIFTVICATPIKKYIYGAIPQAVRKALPLAVGLFIIVVCLRLAAGQDITLGGSIRDIFSVEAGNKSGIVCIIAVAVTLVVGAVLKALGKKRVFKTSLLVGVLVYYLFACILSFSQLIGQDRIFLVVDAYGSYNIATAGENAVAYNFFKVFTSGFDFSAYTANGGNVALLFVQGIVTFLVLGCYDSVGNVQASAAHGNFEVSDKLLYRTLLISGGTNVLAAMLGSAPLSVSSASAAASEEGGKTGLTSVVCCIGYFVCIFTWVVFALLASTLGVSVDYGHAEFGVYTQATFRVVFAAMALVGFSMVLRSVGKLSLDDKPEVFVVTAVALCTAISANITVGIAVGVLCDMLVKLCGRKIRKITVSELVVGILLLFSVCIGVFF